MDNIDNNQFEVKQSNSKRKITAPCPNAYLNPALDILANDDPICNTAMEVPTKKRKRTKSCDITTFENTALDLEVQKAPSNEFLVRELDNVKRNVKLFPFNEGTTNSSNIDHTVANNMALCPNDSELSVNFSTDAYNNVGIPLTNDTCEPIYANLTDIATNVSKISEISSQNQIPEETMFNSVNDTNIPIASEKNNTLFNMDISRINHEDFDSGISVLEQKSEPVANITNIQVNQTVVNSNLSLSFIDRLAIDSPNTSDKSLFLDDDLNESNIMEIKTITIITKKKRIEKKNTNPFLDPSLNNDIAIIASTQATNNPFLELKPEVEQTYQDEILNRPVQVKLNNNPDVLVPRRLFGDTNSTISTVNETLDSHHEYENIDIRPESPIYENIDATINKQSKLLGHDVSQFSATDILNLHANNSNDSNDSKKKHSLFKTTNKLSRKVFNTIKRTFKHDKQDTNITLNPYEVPRKAPKQKTTKKDSGIENPALNLDNSDDLDIEELSDEEHQYETIKTIRNTQLNMNVTPLKARENDIDFVPKVSTPSNKKVRFDSTLNQEKVITGNSFDYTMPSPGFDAKIEKYHDELENCINERKFLQQNM